MYPVHHTVKIKLMKVLKFILFIKTGAKVVIFSKNC